MVIESKFKDYYDFVANQFGGGDPGVYYARGPVETAEVVVSRFPLVRPLNYSHDGICSHPLEFNQLYLVVAGRLYLLSRPYTIDIPIDNISSYRLEYWPEPAVKPQVPRTRRYWWWHGRNHYEFGIERPYLVDLCRKVGAPVFAISDIGVRSGEDVIKVCNQCPILQDVGMASAIPPFQMYQDIAYFVGNTMKERPDNEPPVEISNQEKILKAGFDMKQSFRHRL